MKVNRKKTGIVNKATELAFSINWVKDKVFGMAKDRVIKLSGGNIFKTKNSHLFTQLFFFFY
jgi:hypothetical protein